MQEIKAEILIDAPIQKIWAVLTDFSSYEEWNPFICHIKGKPQLDEQLTILIQLPGKKSINYHAKISAISDYEFTWVGSILIPSMIEGEHRFSLSPLTENQIKFTQVETFTGLLHVPIVSLIYKPIKSGFESMNEALKSRCELNR